MFFNSSSYFIGEDGEYYTQDGKVAFRCLSYKRISPVVLNGGICYINLDDLPSECEELADDLMTDNTIFDYIPINDFEAVLATIYPTIQGKIKEEINESNVVSILKFGRDLKMYITLQHCEQLLCGDFVKKLSMCTRLEIYNLYHLNRNDFRIDAETGKLERPVRTAILISILTNENIDETLWHIGNSSKHRAMEIMAKMMEKRDMLKHTESKISSFKPQCCLDSKEKPIYSDIYFCSTCGENLCFPCSIQYCKHRVNEFFVQQFPFEDVL